MRERIEPNQCQRVAHPLVAFGLVDAAHLEAEADVLRHAHVRKQRVALEHDAEAALVRLGVRDVAAVERDAPARGLDEARDHLQRGGLAAAGRTEQRNELAFLDREIHIGDGLQVAERFRYVREREERHGLAFRCRGHPLNRQSF